MSQIHDTHPVGTAFLAYVYYLTKQRIGTSLNFVNVYVCILYIVLY